MIWVLCALYVSLTAAVVAEANRTLKLDGFRLNFWRIFLGLMLLTPAATMVPWPQQPSFYVAAFFTGAVLSLSAALRMNLSRQKMGRVSTIFLPVEVFAAYLIWLGVDAAYRESALANPFTMAMTLACFALVTAAMMSMRKHDASWKAFLIVAPLGLLHAVNAAGGKWALNDMESGQGTWQVTVLYVFMAFLSATLFAFLLCLTQNIKKNQPWLPPNMMRGALLYAFLGLSGNIAFFYGVAYAPSPAYMSAIIMVAPAWIMLWHKYIGYKDDGNPWAGLTMVFAAIVLIFVTLK